ncbi:MAG: hypothetical protein Q4B09_01645 [Lachnospiraceae bacterium]|nr:hypothetical protein [Lachnospiraceae bacterium]
MTKLFESRPGITERQLSCLYPLQEDGVSLQEALRLCLPEMKKITGGREPEDWLLYCRGILLARYFPESFQTEGDSELEEAAYLYLRVLNLLFEREMKECAFDPLRSFLLPAEEELKTCGVREEYDRFRDAFYEGFIYAFMRISRECTPFDTLGHIAGVHHVAMYMARQLAELGEKVDLGLMSGAAVLHDIGKFGCRPFEARRVPYLHYYYTYSFTDRYEMPAIGSIASNHSVWDLELDRLSVESLLLIYADFRVKSVYTEDRKEQVCFFTLQESYDVILSKLDNVDEQKRRRYAQAYARLRDFEDYLTALGCSTDLVSPCGTSSVPEPSSLMTAEELVRLFKFKAVGSNIRVMYHISQESQFISLLEMVRSEKDSRHVRAFMTVIEEYATYVSQNQKAVILRFFYDMLSHPDGDVRRHAAKVSAKMIAESEIEFTKWLPEGFEAPRVGMSLEEIWRDYLERMLKPENGISVRQRRLIGYAMKTVVSSLLSELEKREEKRAQAVRVLVSFCRAKEVDRLASIFLLNSISVVPSALFSEGERQQLLAFAAELLPTEDSETRVTVLRFVNGWLAEGVKPDREIPGALLQKAETKPGSCAERYLMSRIAAHTGLSERYPEEHFDNALLYIENQSTTKSWIEKQVNLDILKEQMEENTDRMQLYQYANHILSILHLNLRYMSRIRAGSDLSEVMPRLTPAQRYEIVLELMRTLESGEDFISNYLPEYVGRFYFLVTAEERQNLLVLFRKMVDSRSTKNIAVALETLGVILRRMLKGSADDPASCEEELVTVEGLFCLGISHYHPEISAEASYILCRSVFYDPELPGRQKARVFSDLARKVTSIHSRPETDFLRYYSAAAYKYINVFLTDYFVDYGEIPAAPVKKAAFFPGTFDPFSLGHKAIVKEILSLGYTVYLALDDFFWSKKTQPYRIRQKILEMSTADQLQVYVFPDNIPVNIANPDDLRVLTEAFHGEKPAIVVGSDVVRHASAYRKARTRWSIHEFRHIIFSRDSEGEELSREELSVIQAETVQLQLPSYYENVSANRIRAHITEGKDISNLLAANVENFIYELGYYTMEPIFKKTAECRAVDTILRRNGQIVIEADEFWCTADGSCLELQLTEGAECGSAAAGIVHFHMTDSGALYEECGDLECAASLRGKICGRIAVITDLQGAGSETGDDRLTALTETLAICQEKGIAHAMCFGGSAFAELLSAVGFICIEREHDIWYCDLHSPIVLFFDTAASIKELFSDGKQLRKTLWQSHLKLVRAMTQMYPGSLLLAFESDIMNYRLTQLIMKDNPIEQLPQNTKPLGKNMCVPFGKILKGVILPNCVTKALDNEKIYNRDLRSFRIRELPGYLPLAEQIRTIRSFDRPVILADDLYHKSYRIREIDRLVKSEQVMVDHLAVGVLSGHGKDLAETVGRDVRSVYFVPNMRSWFIESDLYPFIGGDGVDTEQEVPVSYSLPSINAIMPYQVPSYIKGASRQAFYRLSEVCLENAAEIWRVLEADYQKMYGRKLTMERIGEVMTEPRHPDSVGPDISHPQAAPSMLLQGELMRLYRMQRLTDETLTQG